MDIFAFVQKRLPRLCLNPGFDFSRHTTFGIGGVAAAEALPANGAELAALCGVLEGAGIPYCYLGAGANVLASDEPFEGVVIRFARMGALSREGTDIVAGAGVTGGALLRFARENGIGGLEFLAGIPMTVGGAAVMNAGVPEGHLGDAVRSVTAVMDGKERVFGREACQFSDKYSVFQEKIAVTRVVMEGYPCDPARIRERERAFLAKRRGLPKGRSAGCVFVNPAGGSAGKLIDDCGFKGLRVGGAYVSPRHANFIVSEGATAGEVAALIEKVKDGVFEKTGILLREEVKRLP